MAHRIPHYDFFHPGSNLGLTRGSNPENTFADKFSSAYSKQFASIHSKTKKRKIFISREIPVSGFGIADVVAVFFPIGARISAFKPDMAEKYRPTVRAFEIKLHNWRKGLMQAHRYSFFSDNAVLVVPHAKIPYILKYLDIFKTLCIGLWSFDTDGMKIRPLFTPRPVNAFKAKHRRIAMQRVIEASTPQAL